MRLPIVAGLLAFGMLLSTAGAVFAQEPPPGEVERMRACLCLKRAMQATRETMEARNRALSEIQQNLADLEAQLARARTQVDPNNPQSVAHYKALLDRRDAAFERSTGPAVTDAQHAVAQFDATVNQYNEQCANRPYYPALDAQLETNLSCPEIK
jgi:hypothetical protein